MSTAVQFTGAVGNHVFLGGGHQRDVVAAFLMKLIEADVVGANEDVAVGDEQGIGEPPYQKLQAACGAQGFTFIYKLDMVVRLQLFEKAFKMRPL